MSPNKHLSMAEAGSGGRPGVDKVATPQLQLTSYVIWVVCQPTFPESLSSHVHPRCSFGEPMASQRAQEGGLLSLSAFEEQSEWHQSGPAPLPSVSLTCVEWLG